MAEKVVALKLKLVKPQETQKALNELTKVSTQWDKTFGEAGNKKIKNQARQIDTLKRTWQDLTKAIKLAKENFDAGFDSAKLRNLEKFNKSLDGTVRKVFNLKNALAGSVAGGALVYGINKLFEEGSQQVKTRRRLEREFGTGYGGRISKVAEGVSFKAGVQGDEAARALIPFAEQLEAIQEGSQFRGQKKPLTAAQAEALKRKNLAFGANVFARVSALAPDVPTEDLGRILADALSGPEGVRSLVSELHLSKRSKTLSQANEKGEAFKALSPEERKKYGVTQKGQFLEQGDLVNLLLERSGISDKAAADAQKTFEFQRRSITAQLTDTLGDIGAGALDSLTEKLGQGATAAERLKSYLASDEGKKTVEGIKDAVVGITEGMVSIAKELPKIGSWLSEHKGTIAGIAAAYAALKAAPGLTGIGGGLQAVGAGNGGKVGAAVGGLGKAASFAGKASAVLGVGLAAYELTHAVDETFGLTDKLVNSLGPKRDKAGEARLDAEQKARDADKAAQVSALEAKGVSRGLAIRYIEHPEERATNPLLKQIADLVARPVEVTINNTTTLDGQAIAKNTEKHLVRSVQNRTAGGAAPVSRE